MLCVVLFCALFVTLCVVADGLCRCLDAFLVAKLCPNWQLALQPNATLLSGANVLGCVGVCCVWCYSVPSSSLSVLLQTVSVGVWMLFL